MSLQPVLHNKKSHCNEKPKHRKEEQPPLHNYRTLTQSDSLSAAKNLKKKSFFNCHFISINQNEMPRKNLTKYVEYLNEENYKILINEIKAELHK